MILAQPERAPTSHPITLASAPSPLPSSKADEGHSVRLTAGVYWRWSNPNPDGKLVRYVTRTTAMAAGEPPAKDG